jgi:hypothetical protein
VISLLEEQKHDHRRAGRELNRLELAGVQAVIVCATDSRRPRDVELSQVRFFARSGLHVVYPSIVGCDLMPNSYYQVKVECENALSGSSHTIVRATQYHQLIWSWFTARPQRRWLIVPAATRYQVLDPAVHARLLVEAALGRPRGRTPDVGGPTAYEAIDLARSCQRAARLRRPVLPLNRRGLFGASLRAGANLTPNRDTSGETWNQFIERKVASASRQTKS